MQLNIANAVTQICKAKMTQTLCLRFYSFFRFGLCLFTTWKVFLKSFWHFRPQYLPFVVQFW